jgi:hypothetical protein
LDAAKKGLDDIIEQYRDPVTAKLNLDERGRSINQLRVSLLGELDRINPSYRAARAAWAGPAASKGAMAQGEKILNTHPEDVKAIFDGMTKSEREHYRIGAGQAYLNQISERGILSSAVRNISRDENESAARERLRPIFRTKKQMNDFIESVTGERAIHATMQSVVGNSATARRTVEDTTPELGPFLEAAHGAKHAFLGNGIESVKSFIRAYRSLGAIKNPQLNEEIARILTNPDILSTAEPGQVLPMFQDRLPGQFLPVAPAPQSGSSQ